MIQEIVVYIILAITIAYLSYVVFKKLKVRGADPCNNCSGCSLKEQISKPDRCT
jgi:predicted PurR-regulated permease PerM